MKFDKTLSDLTADYEFHFYIIYLNFDSKLYPLLT